MDMNGDSMSSELGPVSTWMGDLIRRLIEGIDVSSFLFLNFFLVSLDIFIPLLCKTFHLVVKDCLLLVKDSPPPCEGFPTSL